MVPLTPALVNILLDDEASVGFFLSSHYIEIWVYKYQKTSFKIFLENY